MSVKLGSARIDERGKATGGKAGDQTGKEVSTQSWYAHSKGWRVFRAKDPAAREKIAVAMERACANAKIGYDQAQRNTLYTQVKPLGFDPGKATTACETDCSALVRVCVNYAGITLGDIRTSTEASKLLATGAFIELTGDKYTKKSDYLGRGDILVTKTQGHTVVVISNGSKYEGEPVVIVYALGDRTLKNGCTGDDVKELQTGLIQLGYSCGSWGVDGDFGDATEMAVRAFQADHRVTSDGVVGASTVAALQTALYLAAPGEKTVQIVGGNCYVRDEPGITGVKLGVVYEGNKLPFAGEISEDGWLKVEFKTGTGWVSGKYAKAR